MALDKDRVINAYKSTTYGADLTPESEEGLKDLIGCILDEMVNADIRVDFEIPETNIGTMEVQVIPASFGVPAPLIQPVPGTGIGFGKGVITS